MATQLPSGRWRARVYDAKLKKQIGAHEVIGGPSTFKTKRQAERAEDDAKAAIEAGAVAGVTVMAWWRTWTTDPCWRRPAESTNIHNRERTQKFASRYGDRPLNRIGDDVVSEWLAGGQNVGSVPALRAMFNDAATGLAGRLVTTNPFAELGLKRGRGRKDVQPPSPREIAALVDAARALTIPSFAAYLETAAWTGMRPGELDGLRWDCVRLDDEEIDVTCQWNVKTRTIQPPKHGSRRTIPMLGPVAAVLRALPRESEFVFTNLRGGHWTPSARKHHWDRVRCSVGMADVDLYTATRHYFGWYALNVARIAPHDIARHLGHSDGGVLVVQLYGHPDAEIGRTKVREGFGRAALDAAGKGILAA